MVFKGSVQPKYKNTYFFTLPLVISSQADSLCFICPHFEITNFFCFHPKTMEVNRVVFAGLLALKSVHVWKEFNRNILFLKLVPVSLDSPQKLQLTVFIVIISSLKRTGKVLLPLVILCLISNLEFIKEKIT